MNSSSFLADFLLISEGKTIMFIALLIAVFFAVRAMEKKKIKFSVRMITSTVIGLILGIVIQWSAGFPAVPKDVKWLSEVTSWYGLFGYGFIDLLKMLVVPLVFLSIVRVIINMNGENLGKLTLRSIITLVSTTIIAATIGIVVANIMNLGVGTDMTGIDNAAKMREVSNVIDTIRGLIPSNPVKAMADSNIVAVVIFAGFIGTSINRLKKKHSDIIEPFVGWIQGAYKIMVSVSMTVIKFMPYAVVALLANTITSKGVSALYTVLNFIVALYVSVAIMFVVQLIIASLCGISPMKYLKGVIEALILAFTSRSSLGTLPVTIECLTDNLKVDEGVASFVASLGANMGMNGCAGIYPALLVVTLANMTGMNMDFGFYVMLIIVIAITSLGVAGLPGAATMVVSIVISGIGMGTYFPLAGGIIAIDPILDMGRTMLNVNGSMVSTVVVAKSIDKIEKES